MNESIGLWLRILTFFFAAGDDELADAPKNDDEYSFMKLNHGQMKNQLIKPDLGFGAFFGFEFAF